MEIGFEENNISLSVPITGDIRVTKSELTYYTNIKKCLILVPVEFSTDLGSIPQFLQGIFPKDGKAMYAYILHDYLYATGLFTRSECDAILEEAMKSLGVGWWTRKSVRAGLKLGGWVAWNKHRKGNK
jgi:hypothetical protein